jgi:proliferating cell nuclear antigen
MIELKKMEFLKNALEAISAFIPEGNFRFSDDGVYFKAIDPSQVLLVDYFIDKKLFDKYDIETNFVGIDLIEFNKILQRAMPQDKLSIDLIDSEMKIKLESELKRSFRLPLIDVSEGEIKAPEVKYDAKIIIGSVSLKEMLRDAALFGSSVVLKLKDRKFFVEARGSQGTMDSEATSVSKIEASANVTCKFSLNFLHNIIKEADQGTKVTIELKPDSPMKVSYNIGESKITFYLAHMIL